MNHPSLIIYDIESRYKATHIWNTAIKIVIDQFIFEKKESKQCLLSLFYHFLIVTNEVILASRLSYTSKSFLR